MNKIIKLIYSNMLMNTNILSLFCFSRESFIEIEKMKAGIEKLSKFEMFDEHSIA